MAKWNIVSEAINKIKNKKFVISSIYFGRHGTLGMQVRLTLGRLIVKWDYSGGTTEKIKIKLIKSKYKNNPKGKMVGNPKST